jgi:2-polyprenyl-6-methoxyphenol hydroxylase-like FAD-dependent oxidoreductase
MHQILRDDNTTRNAVIVDKRLRNLLTFRGRHDGILVSLWRFREALIRNLNIEWNKRFVKYEKFEDRVAVYFEDGSKAETDLLVGDDGVHYVMRQQRCLLLRNEFIKITIREFKLFHH